MDPAGNDATSFGPLEACAALPGIGTTLQFDVVIQGVPPSTGVGGGGLGGFQMNLQYNQSVVQVSNYSAAFMLQAGGPPLTPVSASEPVPDADGNWQMSEFEVGGNYESGDGVLIRIELQAVGNGQSPLRLLAVTVFDSQGSPYTIGQITDGSVFVGSPCPP